MRHLFLLILLLNIRSTQKSIDEILCTFSWKKDIELRGVSLSLSIYLSIYLLLLLSLKVILKRVLIVAVLVLFKWLDFSWFFIIVKMRYPSPLITTTCTFCFFYLFYSISNYHWLFTFRQNDKHFFIFWIVVLVL